MERQIKLTFDANHATGIIASPRFISSYSTVFNNTHISPAAYQMILLNNFGVDRIPGIEHDAQNMRLVFVLRGQNLAREAAIQLLCKKWLDELQVNFVIISGAIYSLTGCACLYSPSLNMSMAVIAFSKCACGYTVESPMGVIGVGIAEHTKLLAHGQRWLQDSNTKFVILVDIQEEQNGDWNAANDKYDFLPSQFNGLRYYQPIHKYIRGWYRAKEIGLAGGPSMSLSVHLWYNDGTAEGDRQCVVDKAVFSPPHSLIDLETVEDVPLKLEYLMTAGSDLSGR